ncbi:MAG: hypothetical protein Q9162_001664 [Coniocarpon cinnabarinum]
MNTIGNRNSTPETGSSNLRPPVSRSAFGASHQLRSSTDMSGQSNGPLSARGVRPQSEVYPGQRGQGTNSVDEGDKAIQQWIADIDSYENTLEEMAAATLDKDFKDELSAIEDWFRVLSEAERTAALYALLQQTTQVQTRFFIGVLQQMALTHPMSGVLSPSNFGEKVGFGGGGRAPPSPGAKRNSGLAPSEINSMFPDAAAAIAKQKADFTQKTGTEPRSNRSSAVVGDRASLIAPTISGPPEDSRKDSMAQPSPWGRSARDQDTSDRPRSSQGQTPMGQFQQPPPSAGLRSATRPSHLTSDSNIQSTSVNVPDSNNVGLNMLSPYTGNWGSVSNTPMMPNFNNPQQNPNNPNDLVANATAMKLAALSTVTNRVQLDDARKFRRARSSDGRGPHSPGLPGNGMPMMDPQGQMLSPQQAAALQAQQLAAMQGQRSRPVSPGIAIQGPPGMQNMGMSQNGFLSAYNAQQGLVNGMGGMNLNAMGGMAGMGGMGGGDGFLHDPSEIQRGRSPRGKRGNSRPPEDPTDLELLKDIPAWLRSLRLHKYTDNLKDIKWQDLVQYDEKALEDRGVAAKGARTKMLKVFQEVREAQDKGKIA